MDFKEKIDYATDHQMKQMFTHFFPEELEHRSQEFARRVTEAGQPVSAAQIQGFFMFHKKDPQAAIDNAADVSQV